MMNKQDYIHRRNDHIWVSYSYFQENGGNIDYMDFVRYFPMWLIHNQNAINYVYQYYDSKYELTFLLNNEGQKIKLL